MLSEVGCIFQAALLRPQHAVGCICCRLVYENQALLADVVLLFLPSCRYHKAVSRMERGLPPNTLVPQLRAAVDEYRNLLPVVAAMRNSALKERHWAKVFASIGTLLPRDETFTLQVRTVCVCLVHPRYARLIT